MKPQPLIAVHDVSASRKWYENVLGLCSGHGGDEYERMMGGDRLALQLHQWEVVTLLCKQSTITTYQETAPCHDERNLHQK